ncbi:MAG TPA: hypothetical protein VKH45_13685 [Candidatus Acidoferrum sp.]|nr:hypothetical protein [Candidatus Acidoferrum sp.]
MKDEVPKYVTRARAAFLLGLPAEEIGRISQETGIGHRERSGNIEETFFTYAELQKICVLATVDLDKVLH